MKMMIVCDDERGLSEATKVSTHMLIFDVYISDCVVKCVDNNRVMIQKFVHEIFALMDGFRFGVFF